MRLSGKIGIAALVAAFALGYATHSLVRLTKRQINPPNQWSAMPMAAPQDIAESISIHSVNDAHAVRAKLIHFVYGNDWQTSIPMTQVPNPPSDLLPQLESLLNSQAITLVPPDVSGVRGETYIFPHADSSCLIVYNQGHGDEVFNSQSGSGREILRTLSERGCDVILTSMPMAGLETETITVETARGILRGRSNHDLLDYATVKSGSPVRAFFDHVRGGIDYAIARRGQDYPLIAMLGLSGGGWVTTVYAAMDERVRISFSVAGSLPLSMRAMEPRHWGDWEQTVLGLDAGISYTDLYILGTTSDRHVELAYNKYDSCCFGGDEALTMKKPIRSAVQAIGGNFNLKVYSDEQGHKISGDATQRFFEVLSTYQERLRRAAGQ